MTLRLYQLDGCPHCKRVVEVLEDLELEYESVWVEAPHSKRDEVKRISGQRSVPVLVDGDRGVVMPESERIVEYLTTNYGQTADVASR